MLKWFFGVLLFASIAIAAFFLILPQKYFENILEKYFGMPVSIGSVFYHPHSKTLFLKKVKFSNQSGFSSSDHFRVEELRAEIDLRKIFDQKHVDIKHLYLKHPYFLIERILDGDQRVSNLGVWIKHIQSEINKKQDSYFQQMNTLERRRWHVTIDKIDIEDGVFEFNGLDNNDYYFSQITGSMEGYEWPTTNPENLYQDFIFNGKLGQNKKALFAIEGQSNFGSRILNFDVKANVDEADLLEYKRFLKNFPVAFSSGIFNLSLWMKCQNGVIDSKTELKLYQLDVRPEDNIKDLVLGIPVLSALKFIESEESILLNIPVSGKIKDPDFKFEKAFRDAFQQALTSYLRTGVKILISAPVKIAGKATVQVEKTTKQIESTTNGAVELIENVASKVISGGKK